MKHSSLTRFFKRKSDFISGQTAALQDVLWYCDVNNTVGCLPPELRSCLNKNELSIKTKLFSQYLSEFIRKNISVIRFSKSDLKYDLPNISELFGTKCHIETAKVEAWGLSKWEGSFAVVGKVVFPEIRAEYALKIFVDPEMIEYDMHGKNYEIPVAFAAFNSEPKQNNVCYMASFVDAGYMLSKWMGEQDEIPAKENKNPIFHTTPSEKDKRNCRQGKLIDFGETFKSPYGYAEYRIRKLYRKFVNNPDELKKALNTSNNYLQQQQIKSAMNLMQQMADFNQKMR